MPWRSAPTPETHAAPTIPVVAWSGSDAVEGESELLRAGASAYFEKRDLKRLMGLIRELLGREQSTEGCSWKLVADWLSGWRAQSAGCAKTRRNSVRGTECS
jgi:hypothetical protein